MTNGTDDKTSMNRLNVAALVCCLPAQGCANDNVCSGHAGKLPGYSGNTYFSENHTHGPRITFTNPNNVIDMLNNARIAWCSDLLLDGDFFEEAKLIKMSGGTKVSWAINNPQTYHVFVSGLESILPNLPLGHIMIPSMQYDIFRYEPIRGRQDAVARLSFYEPPENLSFDKITQIFGPGWKEAPDRSISLHAESAKPNTPHSKDRIRYLNDSILIAKSLTIEFHSNGLLSSVSFEEETR
jgi:hypothetical protein